jgi:hypothetical protein
LLVSSKKKRVSIIIYQTVNDFRVIEREDSFIHSIPNLQYPNANENEND